MSGYTSKTLIIFSAALFFSSGAWPQQQAPATGARDLFLTVGKSLIVDSPAVIERVSVANGATAEALATSPREVLVNGKVPGETSLIVWQQGGNRLIFDLHVQASNARIDAINRQLQTELPDQKVSVDMEEGVPFVHGTVNNLNSADRAVMIASVLGKPVNLLRVNVPQTEAQILIKVKFADVDRSHSSQLGLNLFSTGATNTPGSISTGQFTPPQVTVTPATNGTAPTTSLSLTNALNVFFFRPDLNLGATIEALQANAWLQILAEPNLLTMNNHAASFLAGGEFPFPTLQGGGAGLGAVTVTFREFGVRVNFLPTVTPRGTIRLQVTPEVSTLDFANGLTVSGFTIPALDTRRVQTEVELESGQSFAIGGLLDNRVTKTLSKIPGLGDIPFFGKLFQSRNLSKTNSELLIIVTPELVRPIPSGQPLPNLKFPVPFMQSNTSPNAPRTPGIETTGSVPVHPPQATIPVEELIQSQQRPGTGATQQTSPQIQFVPMVTPPAAPAAPAPQQPAAKQSQPESPDGAAPKQ